MIYFIQCGGRRGPVKIGFTAKDAANARLIEMQTSTPYSLKVLGEMEGKQSDEKRIHAIFKNSRIGGEWFKYSDALYNFIESSCNLRSHNAIMELINKPINATNFENEIKIGFKLRDKLQEIEKEIITCALKNTGWIQTRAAELLGIGKSGLNQKMRKYKINIDPVE